MPHNIATDADVAALAAPKVNAPIGISADDLLNDNTIVVPELAIEGFLPRTGVVIVAGRPKCCKTWFGVQTALSIVTGTALGGWLKVNHPGRAHIWALEDQYPISKDKILKLLRGSRPAGLHNLKIFDHLARPLLQGGDEIIRATLRESPVPVNLLMLDSLFKLLGHQQASYDISARDYHIVDVLRKIAIEFKCVILLIAHSRKGARGGDPIENLMGTTGNTAAADVICELTRTGKAGKLSVTGRIVQREDYQLIWHEGDEWGWTIEGAGDDAVAGETSDEVLAFLEAQGASKPSTIASGIHKSFGAVWQSLLRLQGRGLVSKGADKRWERVR